MLILLRHCMPSPLCREEADTLSISAMMRYAGFCRLMRDAAAAARCRRRFLPRSLFHATPRFFFATPPVFRCAAIDGQHCVARGLEMPLRGAAAAACVIGQLCRRDYAS